MNLRPYQLEAVAAVYGHLAKKATNPCVVIPTAGGKSLVLGQIAADVVSRWNGRVCILAHVKELLEQNAAKVRALCPEIEVGVYSAGLNSRDTSTPVVVAGIQSVYQRADELGAFDLVIIDEAHLLNSENDESMYRTFLDASRRICPHQRVVGFTATPYRVQGGLICKPENVLNEVCYEVGVRRLIAEGYISPLTAKCGHSTIDLTDLHVRAGEFVAEDVDKAVANRSAVDSSVADMVERAKARKSIIVFCSSVAHCSLVADRIRELTGDRVAVVTGDTPSGERAKIISEFKGVLQTDLFGNTDKPLRWLCNMGVLTTGFDAPNIDCVVLLRPTKSAGLYVQMCLDAETEILSYRGWAKMGSLSVGDPVYSFDVGTGRIRPDEVVSVVSRLTDPNERFITVRAPHLDIRTTSLHDFVYRNRNARWNWLKKTGEELALQKDSFLIPVAGWAPQDDTIVHADLTDDEIRFVGWTLSDGCVNKANNTICISQSSKSPYVADIEKMLNGCGFGWSRYVRHYKGDLAKYPPNYRYIIPFGRSRKTGRRGWKDLAPRIRRRPLEAFDDFSARQLWILLEAMNLANGSKQKEIDWIPRGFNICFGDKFDRASDIQALCIMRGFRCNLSVQRGQVGEFHVHGKAKDQTIMRVKPQLDATIGGANSKGRCKFEFERPQMPERVWCIETHAGTIVTRRHGKVAILGNCGRGFRLSPETGKENCLVLDYGGNIARHGPVDAVTVKENRPTGQKGEAPMAKECPNCAEMVHPAVMVCPSCGFEFPKPASELDERARNGGILSGEVSFEEHQIKGADYQVHVKRGAEPGAPRTVECDYWDADDFRTIHREWLCPEHEGFARQKFERWWRDHARRDIPPPTSAEEVAAMCREPSLVRQPSAITVKTVAGEKYPRVVGYSLKDFEDVSVEVARQFHLCPYMCGDGPSGLLCKDVDCGSFGKCQSTSSEPPEPGADLDLPPPQNQNENDWSFDDDLPF